VSAFPLVVAPNLAVPIPELLRTLVIGLIATRSPDELNPVLVDFKGGAKATLTN